MSVRSLIRDRTARGLYLAAKKLGVQISLVVRGSSPVSLWCFETGYTRSLSALRSPATQQAIRFIIPQQTDFPPEGGLNSRSYIEYNDVRYGLDGVSKDNLEAIWRLDCVRLGTDGDSVGVDDDGTS